jgi:dolichol-phosphate mannosyltransferase
VVSLLSGLLMIWLKFVHGVSMIQTPLPLFSAMTFLVSVQSILMGLVAEIVVRTYFEARDRRVYSVREVINFEDRS